jgi:hypothetical protein
MNKADLPSLSATALSAWIRTKAVSPRRNSYMIVWRDDTRATYPLAYASSAAVADRENHASTRARSHDVVWKYYIRCQRGWAAAAVRR